MEISQPFFLPNQSSPLSGKKGQEKATLLVVSLDRRQRWGWLAFTRRSLCTRSHLCSESLEGVLRSEGTGQQLAVGIQSWSFQSSYFFLQLQPEAEALAIWIPTRAGSREQREDWAVDADPCDEQSDGKCHWRQTINLMFVSIKLLKSVHPTIHPFILPPAYPSTQHPSIVYPASIHSARTLATGVCLALGMPAIRLSPHSVGICKTAGGKALIQEKTHSSSPACVEPVASMP